jgi:hypothetical protein
MLSFGWRMLPAGKPLHWTFQSAYPEQAEPLRHLAEELAPEFAARVEAAGSGRLRAGFSGDGAEERARAYWLLLHQRALDEDLALELAPESQEPAEPAESRSAADAMAISPPAGDAALARLRPPIPEETLYDLLRADDPEMDQNLERTIAWIEAAGLPVINLLSYLDLPLYLGYAADHPAERDQIQFLHVLHTWTCYRRFGQVRARLPPSLVEAFADPRYLRISTNQFRSPAPALCLQLPDWTLPLRGGGGRPALWAKEIYITHLEPPTPADDRELTLMIITCDEQAEFGFIPLEVPLSLPGLEQSIDAFFAPSLGDDELGANTADLRRLTALAAVYCLYASAADPGRYLPDR